MDEEEMKAIISKIKIDSFSNFKSKVLGDINNQKGNEYLDKLKKQFKKKYEQIKIKNF